MDISTAQRLSEVTSSFYASNAESFTSTRQRSWEGWTTVVSFIAPLVNDVARKDEVFRVLDVGCGNLRFEAMLEEAFPEARFKFYAVDNCAPLASTHGMPLRSTVHFQQLDIMESLESESLGDDLTAPECDLCVAFGLLHHIPLAAWRRDLIDELVFRTKPSGLTAITFWQFAKDDKARKKAIESTMSGCRELGVALNTDEGDYLLGWQGTTVSFRYCHSFSDAEIEGYARHAESDGAMVYAEFSSDGRDGRSNKYLLLRPESTEPV